ncbi:MAG: MarR family transcriptional regulator [Anaerolineales bacterium]
MTTRVRPQPAIRHAIDTFWDTVPPLWTRIREHLRDVVLAHVDLTVEQFHVLRQIRQGTASVSALAAARGISRPAISQAIDGLVNKGLLIRRPSAADRRYVKLALTPKGNSLLDDIFEQNRAWMAQRLAPLTAHELGSIQRGLDTLRQAFDGPDE